MAVASDYRSALMKFIKSFLSSKKIIDHKVAYFFGVQVFRVLLFRLALFVSRKKNSIALPANLESLKQEGLVIIQNYLSEQEFEEIRQAYYEILKDYRAENAQKHRSANALDLTKIRLTPRDVETYPVLDKIFRSPEIKESFSYLSGKTLNVDEIYVEFVQHTKDEHDPCTNLHTDTFFPNQNAWLYVEDSNLDCGPFIYSRGSHRVTIKRLVFEYYSSIKHFSGGRSSPRVSEKFAQFLDLSPTDMSAPQNSLLISNNFGIHARGIGTPGTTRAAFKLSYKETPFSRRRDLQ
jgi:hypothetical protein